MNSQWFSMVALLAALMIGYSFLNNRDSDSFDRQHDQPTTQGYYLKDAVITETAESGAPRLRLAASEVAQNMKDDSLALAAVRADYVWTAKERNAANASSHHWVLNADNAVVPAGQKSTAQITLRGNVEAHSVDAPHTTVVNTQSLDIDTGKQLARSADKVVVDIDGHTANSRGLLVDMQKNRVQFKSDVVVQLAANNRGTRDEGKSAAGDTAPISLPDVFKSERGEYNDNILVLSKVCSTSEPFICADQASATGIDLANNKVVLRGSVRLELPKRGLVTADSATVIVRNNRVVHAQLVGAPVNFQHQRKGSGDLVRGRGALVDYDVPTQTLRFPSEAWFSDGKIEFTAESLEYDLQTEHSHAERPTIRVMPRKDDAVSPSDAGSPGADAKALDSTGLDSKSNVTEEPSAS